MAGRAPRPPSTSAGPRVRGTARPKHGSNPRRVRGMPRSWRSWGCRRRPRHRPSRSTLRRRSGLAPDWRTRNRCSSPRHAARPARRVPGTRELFKRRLRPSSPAAPDPRRRSPDAACSGSRRSRRPSRAIARARCPAVTLRRKGGCPPCRRGRARCRDRAARSSDRSPSRIRSDGRRWSHCGSRPKAAWTISLDALMN
jgi:hypothetical protein